MNAKEELIDKLNECGKKIICAKIQKESGYYGEKSNYNLKLSYTERDYLLFFNSIDFEYHNGYGGQELYGTVWLEDNTWLERAEYDGSEWWVYKETPEIPEELR